MENNISTVGDSISTAEEYYQYCRGIAAVHVGDSFSTVEAIQYCRGKAAVLLGDSISTCGGIA